MNAQTLEARATRWLARRAFAAGAIDPVTLDFILDEPTRAEECSEWIEWLAAEAAS